MLNFQNPTIKNNDCYCCGTIRRHPKPNWHGCLNFKKPSCPKMNTPSHNVLAPSNAQHSKVMRDVQQLKVAAPGRGRWKKSIGDGLNYNNKQKNIRPELLPILQIIILI